MMSSRALVVVAVASLVATLLVGVAPARAAHDGPGDLDPTFAGDGTITTNVTGDYDEAHAMAVQDDGKIVLAGFAETDADGTDGEFMAAARLNADGTLDTSFGDGGSVLIDFGNEERANAVVVQDDGHIVLAGVAEFGSAPPSPHVAFNDFVALVRLTEDGMLDPSFSGGGVAVAPTGDFGDESAAHGVAVDGDGNIVAVGSADGQTAVIRTNPDGTLDTDFDGDGAVLVDVDPGSTLDQGNAVVLDGADQIVVAGAAGTSATLLRVLPNGTLDPTFDGDGIVTTAVAEHALEAHAVALDPDGAIVSAGFSDPTGGGSADYRFAVLRHTAAGAADTTFDGDGLATIEISEDRRDQASAVGVDADGAVVTAGRVHTAAGTTDFALARLNADGTPDTGFDADGVVITVKDGNDQLRGLALREIGGKTAVVTAGFSVQATGMDFTAARYDADSGELDADFGGGDGIASVGVGTGEDRGRAAALQPDGKLLVVNERFDEAVLRYLPDGSLDAGFGDGGVVGPDTVMVPTPKAVLLQPDSRIVVAGDASAGFVAQRLEADGATDTSYGAGGLASASFVGDEVANDAALTPDGAAVVAGWADTDSGDQAFALARFTTGGDLDTAFGDGGRVVTPIGDGAIASAVLVADDGRIVVAGRSGTNFAVARYSAAGALDPTFGTGGIVTDRIDEFANVADAALQADGKILLAGSRLFGGERLGVVRLNADGSPDTGFDGDGVALAPFAGDAAGRSLAVQPNGRIVVVGYEESDETRSFALARFEPDGSLDSSFGNAGDGTQTTPFSGAGAEAEAVVLQPDDGKIVAVGTAMAPLRGADVATPRYQGDAPARLTVNSTGDDADADSGDGTCDTGGEVGDDPECTLRAAIQQANATDGEQLIAFDIGEGGLATIAPASALPTIADPVTIDGTTQSGWVDDPIIEVDGTAAGPSTDGLLLTGAAGGSTIRGLVVNNFTYDGIDVDGADGTVIAGNWLGVDADGVTAHPNGDSGLDVVDSAGTTVSGNVISGNDGDGIVVIDTSGLVIRGNRIGVTATGNDELPNGESGIDVFTPSGTAATVGLVVGGVGAGRGNVISANGEEGIFLEDVIAPVIQGNLIGVGADGVTPLGNGEEGIDVSGDSVDVLIGGAEPEAGNVISDNVLDGIQLRSYDGGTPATGTRIENNLIGVGADGVTALGNGDDGLDVRQGANNTTVVDNVISGNGDDGLAFQDGHGTTLLGNHVGVDALGTTGVGNGDDGILFLDYTEVVIGGSASGEGNVIAANGEEGVQAQTTSDLVIMGNFVGVDVTGNEPLGNVGEGLLLDGHALDNATGIVVGGTAAGEGNVIGDSGEQGIQVEEATGTVVQGNHIGVGADGVSDVGNAKEGIVLHGESVGTVVGGTDAGAANMIAGNGGHGVHARSFTDDPESSSMDNQVIGNRIGLDSAGEPLANDGDGVHIGDASEGNTILGNEITASGGLGIDLAPDGVTANDGPGDADSGPNGLQNFPVIDTATVTTDGVRVVGQLDSEPNESFSLEFFANAACDPSDHGEGARPLGTVPVDTDGDGIAEFDETLDADGELGEQITATATGDTDGNTSEFSACREAAAPDGPPDPDPGDDTGGGGGGGGTPDAPDCPSPTPESVTCAFGSDGGTASTGGEQADEDNPIITTVTTPNAGTVTIDEASDGEGEGHPGGFEVLDLSVDIDAPTASADNPLIMTFRIDGSRLPDGHDASTVEVFRDGAFVPDCEAAPVPGEAADPDGQPADPDPCVFTRVQDGDDTVLTVLTSQASIWTFAVAVDACIVDLVPDAGFGDVPTGNVHRVSIDCLVWYDIARGVTAQRYAPGEDVTRAQIASFVTQLIESTGAELPAGDDAFVDDDGSVHQDNINKLAAAGLVSGTTETRYAPNATVTRAQMATMLVNAAGYVTDASIEPTRDYFNDDERSLHENNINKAREAGFTAGVTTTTYEPTVSVSREQMASFLVNVVDLFIAKGFTTLPG